MTSPDKMPVLRDQIARIERNRVDTALPAGGLVLGALHDILAPSEATMTAAMGFCTVLLARWSGLKQSPMPMHRGCGDSGWIRRD
jgi:hypothetical protein